MVFKEIDEKEMNEIIASTGFDYDLLVKDYYITILLYLMRDIRGIFFKGGTALQKTIFDYSRISEDIDFTLDRDVHSVKEDIINSIKVSKIFGPINKDKDVDEFTRLVVPYNTELSRGSIFIDLNERGKLLLRPDNLKMKHFYPNIPEFTFPCLDTREMIAEKVAASIGRNKPRDHYDIYQIIRHKLPIDMSIVEEKCRLSGYDPDILDMFKKAKKLHKRWKEDMEPLLVDPISYEEVMRTLSRYFIKGDDSIDSED